MVRPVSTSEVFLKSGLMLRRVRQMIYFSAVWTALSINLTVAPGADIRLRYTLTTEYYAIAAVALLYVALMIGPLLRIAPDLPGGAVLLRSRRAFGLAAFMFAALHGGYAFFTVVGGIDGLGRLGSENLFAVILGMVNLALFAFPAVTSFNAAQRRLGIKRWSMIHRLVYIVAIVAIIHASILGSHFRRPSLESAQIAIAALVVMALVQILRIVDSISNRRYRED